MSIAKLKWPAKLCRNRNGSHMKIFGYYVDFTDVWDQVVRLSSDTSSIFWKRISSNNAITNTPFRHKTPQQWAKTSRVHTEAGIAPEGKTLGQRESVCFTGRSIRLFDRSLHLWSEWISSINIGQDARHYTARNNGLGCVHELLVDASQTVFKHRK